MGRRLLCLLRGDLGDTRTAIYAVDNAPVVPRQHRRKYILA